MSDDRPRMALSAFRPDPRNPKAHDLGQIILSIRTNGFVEGPLVDLRTGLTLGGHGRTEALQIMKRDGEKVPEGITLTTGPDAVDWLVPYQWTHTRDDAHAARIILALNQTTILGGWDDSKTAVMLAGLTRVTEGVGIDAALVGTGFDAEDLGRIMDRVTGVNTGTRPADQERPCCEKCGRPLPR